MTNIENKVCDCIKPIIEELGYELYDVIYEKEGQDNYLRIIIDKEDGISINDCESVNNAITDVLDEKDFIKNAYILEVSSPGIERRLRSDEHIKQNIGSKIEVHTYKNIEELKSKTIIGILKGFDDETIELEITVDRLIKKIKIGKNNISKMTTVYDWQD